jgi:hypothetical protein
MERAFIGESFREVGAEACLTRIDSIPMQGSEVGSSPGVVHDREIDEVNVNQKCISD